MEEHFSKIISSIGEDVGREGLKKTPFRAAKAFSFLTKGYHESLEEIINHAIYKTQNNEMVMLKNIELYSLCEHHLLPFIGKCHVAYIPKNYIIGLSKIARIVEYYARRLQVQENLTKQIADEINSILNPSGVAVVIEAQHLCMKMRGIEKQNSVMSTSVMLGNFRDSYQTRSEFLSLIK